MNKVFLVGRISSIKEHGIKGDIEYINFFLAVRKTRKITNGESNAYFFKCVAYNNTAKIIKEYGLVGRLLVASGVIDVNNFDTLGIKHISYQLIINEINFLDSKSKYETQEEKETLEEEYLEKEATHE